MCDPNVARAGMKHQSMTTVKSPEARLDLDTRRGQLARELGRIAGETAAHKAGQYVLVHACVELSLGVGRHRAQRFSEVDVAPADLVPEPNVRLLGERAVCPRIGGHFRASFGASPRFRRIDQGTPNPLTTKVRGHE